MRKFHLHTWIETPDGQGEIVLYDVTQARPYYVQLDRAGVDCSADNLCQYAEAELTRHAPPAWKRMRDKQVR